MSTVNTESVTTSQEAPKADLSATSQEVETQETPEVSEEALEAQSPEAKDESDKRKRDAESRIKKLLQQQKDERREKEYWKKVALERAEAEKQKAEAPKQETKKSVMEDGPPDPETFNGTHAEFLKATAKWEARQELKAWQAEQESKEKEAKTKSEIKKLDEAWAKRYTDFRKENPDIDELLDQTSDDFKISDDLADLIKKSPMGPAAYYHLLKNTDEAARLSALYPMEAAVEFGILVAELKKAAASTESSQEEKEQPKKISSAPKPLNPVGKGAGKAVGKSIADPDISFDEYVRLRRAGKTRG